MIIKQPLSIQMSRSVPEYGDGSLCGVLTLHRKHKNDTIMSLLDPNDTTWRPRRGFWDNADDTPKRKSAESRCTRPEECVSQNANRGQSRKCISILDPTNTTWRPSYNFWDGFDDAPKRKSAEKRSVPAGKTALPPEPVSVAAPVAQQEPVAVAEQDVQKDEGKEKESVFVAADSMECGGFITGIKQRRGEKPFPRYLSPLPQAAARCRLRQRAAIRAGP